MKTFRVAGKFRMGHSWSPFTLETIGKDDKDAQSRVLALLGSRHRVNRHQVTISKVEPITLEQAEDPTLEKRLANAGK